MSQKYSSIHDEALNKRNLYIFVTFLAVLLLISSFNFGYRVFAIAAVAYAVTFIIELLYAKMRKQPIDRTWFITPMVLTLLLPANIPLWIAGVGAATGIFFGKIIFGGTGKNIFNPALVGALFITISFISPMTTQWPEVAGSFTTWLGPLDAAVGATPLNLLSRGMDPGYTVWQFLIGQGPGAIGETFRLGILLFGGVLIALKVVDWRIPIAMLSAVFLFTLIGYLFDRETFIHPQYSLVLGGVMFAAFFVATDPVTAPIKPWGKVFYGIGIGLITVIIRHYAAFFEGVMFAIIVMNAIAPLFDNWRDGPVPELENQEEEATA